MRIVEAQEDVRRAFVGGFAGQLVSGAIWLASAAAWATRSPRDGIVVLAVGGAFIFPLTMLVLRLLGRPARLAAGNPFDQLARQVAFTVPLGLPLVGAATLHRTEWFYPAFLVVVGAHYLPFVFLYGMRMFYLLAVLMVAGGLLIGLYLPQPAHLGGWLGGALLWLFSASGYLLARRAPAARGSAG